MFKYGENCVVCWTRFFYNYALFSGIVFVDCKCPHSEKLPIEADFHFSKQKFLLSISMYILGLLCFSGTTFCYVNDLLSVDSEHFIHYSIFAIYGLIVETFVITKYKTRILLLKSYRKLMLENKVHLEKSEMAHVEILLRLLTGALLLFAFGITTVGILFIDSSDTMIIAYVALGLSLLLTMMSIYSVTFLKFFEIKLLSIILAKGLEKIRFALNAILYEDEFQRILFEKHLLNPAYKKEKLSVSFRKCFSCYKSVIQSLHYFNRDNVISVSGFYQIVILVLCIFFTSKDKETVNVAFRLVTTGTLIWIFLYFCMIIDEMVSKSEELLSFLFQFPISKLSPADAAQVEILIETLTNQKPVITASNMFTVDKKLLAPILGTVVTYVLVAIQFHVPEPTNMETNNTTIFHK